MGKQLIIKHVIIVEDDDDYISFQKENDLNIKRFREVLGKSQEVLEYFWKYDILYHLLEKSKVRNIVSHHEKFSQKCSRKR